MTLFLTLTLFHHLIDGFRNHDLRQHVANLLGVSVTEYTSNQMTYDLRRLRLKVSYRTPLLHPPACLFSRCIRHRELQKPFNTQRLVPAPFNEFYPKCSGPTIPSLHTILPPEHFR